MPLYEVRRRTVLTFSLVEAEDEMRARIAARDIWQTDAGIASLTADVIRVPNSDARYEETDTDRGTERRSDRRWTPREIAGYHSTIQRLREER